MSNENKDTSALTQEQLEQEAAIMQEIMSKLPPTEKGKELSQRRLAAMVKSLVKQALNARSATSAVLKDTIVARAKDAVDKQWSEDVVSELGKEPTDKSVRTDANTGSTYMPAGFAPQIPDAVIPIAPPGLELPTLPCGFYLMYSATAAGKSLTAAALAIAYSYYDRGVIGYPDSLSSLWVEKMLEASKLATAAAAEDPPRRVSMPPLYAGYLYAYEARAAQGFLNTPQLGGGKPDDWSGPGKFVDRLSWLLTGKTNPDRIALPDDQMPDPDDCWASHGLSGWAKLVKAGIPQVFVVDSITLPMRAYCAGTNEALVPTRSGEPTMPQGLQPSDIDFCVKMQDMAVRNHLVVIGVVNSDLVPFADKLEAVCEGTMEVDGPCMARVRSRRDRSFRKLDLTTLKNPAAAYLNYVAPVIPDFIPGVLGL